MLVADDQLVQQAGILALQPLGNGKVFLPDLLFGDRIGIRGEKLSE